MSRPAPSSPPFKTDQHCLSEESIGLLVKQVYQSITRMVDREMAPLDLTAMQWRPLLLIAKRQAETPAELARLAGVDTGAITRTLDRLESKGLLRRVRCQEDRRVVRLEITEAGLATCAQIPPVLARALDPHLRGFTVQEAETLSGLLRRMIANGSCPG
ncbi:MarR family transcriptional regulator [Orrella sp. JC864]|uniref:MarR family winged helix-turn-helix transcriptional regulator n=1 Tax=Orrella sp. JC864 TaxID=3120298 RepID=UPI00300AEFFB